MTRALLVLALALLAACALPAASSAATETASSGQITAHFNYEGSQSKGYSNLALTINRAGATAYDAPVNTSLCGNMCWPAGSGQTPSVAVRDLDGDGDPEVLLDLYSGGAHCCFVSDLLGWDPDSGIYRVVEKTWGDPGYNLVDLNGDGRPELKSADDRFAYQFESYAFSGLPLQIWRYDHGKLSDVTKQFPALIRADAAHWLKQFKREARHRLGAGFLAAWAADEELLGRRRLVSSTLKNAVKHKQLRDPGVAHGRKYLRALMSFLRKNGYLS